MSLGRSPTALVGLGFCFWVAGCHDPTGWDGLQATFLAVPDTARGGDTVDVVFTLRNTTGLERLIRSTYGCLYFLQVFLADEAVPWDGSDYGCAAAITDFTLPPGDSLYWVHPLVAIRAGLAPTNPASVLPAGTYRIRTRMNTDLPDIEALVTVATPPGVY